MPKRLPFERPEPSQARKLSRQLRWNDGASGNSHHFLA